MTHEEDSVPGYTLLEDSGRISALTEDGLEICGAYQPVGHDYWSLYVTKLVTAATGLTTPPHREHFHGLNGAMVARSWIMLIATLFTDAQKNRISA